MSTPAANGAMWSSRWGPVMTADSGPGRDENRPVVYEIKIKGHVSRRWAGWFDGLAIILEADGSTRLIGPVADQAALHGFLKKVRDLGAPLLSVNAIDPRAPAPSGTESHKSE